MMIIYSEHIGNKKKTKKKNKKKSPHPTPKRKKTWPILSEP
jgi:hypothetical protein